MWRGCRTVEQRAVVRRAPVGVARGRGCALGEVVSGERERSRRDEGHGHERAFVSGGYFANTVVVCSVRDQVIRENPANRGTETSAEVSK